MRIAVDGRAFSSTAAGIRRYVGELYKALAVVAEGSSIDAIGGLASAAPSSCHVRDERWSPPTNLGRHAVGLPRTLRAEAYDVYHAPAYVSPLWGSVPTVLSVHDIVYAAHPEWYPYRRDPLRRWFYRTSVARAGLILASSTFTADELRRVYGVPAARVRVVPLAAADAFRVTSPAPVEARSPVLLHVGDLHPRRDLVCAVRVLQRLVRAGAHGWTLVLIGRDQGSLAAVRQAASEAGVTDRVTHLTSVTDDELRAWCGRSFALLYPSRYEGFGFPVVEAMASGLPVVAADAASVPEVLAGAGALFAPGDDAAAAGAISELADATTYRERQYAGLSRAATLTWERTARLTLEAFEEAARG